MKAKYVLRSSVLGLTAIITMLLVAEALSYKETVLPSVSKVAIVETKESVKKVYPTESVKPVAEIDNYDYVVRVVMHESGNQSLEGQMAVAQCIRNTAQVKGISLYEVVTEPGQYASPYPGKVTDSIIEACDRVFRNGESVVDAPIRWFYNPSNGYSKWHESKTYVTTIGAHRFFA